MLGKLIKNEFKATARTFGVMYLIVFIITVVLKIFVEIENAFHIDNVVVNILVGVTNTAFIFGIIGVVIGTVILILKRFYDSMLKREGYLSFTLPVSVGQHIASKSIVSYVWIIASFVFIIAIVATLFIGNLAAFVGMRNELINLIKEISRQNLWKYIIMIAVLMMLAIYTYIAMGYACFSVGQAWTGNRIAGAIATYIVFKIIIEIVSAIGVYLLFNNNMNATLENVGIGDAIFQPILIFAIVQQVVIAILSTIATYYALSRKLNLE